MDRESIIQLAVTMSLFFRDSTRGIEHASNYSGVPAATIAEWMEPEGE